MICSKCTFPSGDDWRQCGKSCPMPMSPHFSSKTAEEYHAKSRLADLQLKLQSKPHAIAEGIVFCIARDIRTRNGFDKVWADADDHTIELMIDDWNQLVLKVLGDHAAATTTDV